MYYLDDDWLCHAWTGPGHRRTTRFLLIKLFCQPFRICSGTVALATEVQYLCLRLPGALWCKRSKYLQTHTKVVLFAANPHNPYRDISVVVAENNDVVKPKCQQETSLNKTLSNFSKVLIVQISFTAVINNGGIGKGISGIRKCTKKNYIYVL